MGKKSGDKSKYYRERRKKYAKRVRMRALRKERSAPVKAEAARAAK
jgi:hypothetical protein